MAITRKKRKEEDKERKREREKKKRKFEEKSATRCGPLGGNPELFTLTLCFPTIPNVSVSYLLFFYYYESEHHIFVLTLE